jgi:hypothetical protein
MADYSGTGDSAGQKSDLSDLTFAEHKWRECSAESGYPLRQDVRDLRAYGADPATARSRSTASPC